MPHIVSGVGQRGVAPPLNTQSKAALTQMLNKRVQPINQMPHMQVCTQLRIYGVYCLAFVSKRTKKRAGEERKKEDITK